MQSLMHLFLIAWLAIGTSSQQRFMNQAVNLVPRSLVLDLDHQGIGTTNMNTRQGIMGPMLEGRRDISMISYPPQPYDDENDATYDPLQPDMVSDQPALYRIIDEYGNQDDDDEDQENVDSLPSQTRYSPFRGAQSPLFDLSPEDDQTNFRRVTPDLEMNPEVEEDIGIRFKQGDQVVNDRSILNSQRSPYTFNPVDLTSFPGSSWLSKYINGLEQRDLTAANEYQQSELMKYYQRNSAAENAERQAEQPELVYEGERAHIYPAPEMLTIQSTSQRSNNTNKSLNGHNTKNKQISKSVDVQNKENRKEVTATIKLSNSNDSGFAGRSTNLYTQGKNIQQILQNIPTKIGINSVTLRPFIVTGRNQNLIRKGSPFKEGKPFKVTNNIRFLQPMKHYVHFSKEKSTKVRLAMERLRERAKERFLPVQKPNLIANKAGEGKLKEDEGGEMEEGSLAPNSIKALSDSATYYGQRGKSMVSRIDTAFQVLQNVTGIPQLNPALQVGKSSFTNSGLGYNSVATHPTSLNKEKIITQNSVKLAEINQRPDFAQAANTNTVMPLHKAVHQLDIDLNDIQTPDELRRHKDRFLYYGEMQSTANFLKQVAIQQSVKPDSKLRVASKQNVKPVSKLSSDRAVSTKRLGFNGTYPNKPLAKAGVNSNDMQKYSYAPIKSKNISLALGNGTKPVHGIMKKFNSVRSNYDVTRKENNTILWKSFKNCNGAIKASKIEQINEQDKQGLVKLNTVKDPKSPILKPCGWKNSYTNSSLRQQSLQNRAQTSNYSQINFRLGMKSRNQRSELKSLLKGSEHLFNLSVSPNNKTMTPPHTKILNHKLLPTVHRSNGTSEKNSRDSKVSNNNTLAIKTLPAKGSNGKKPSFLPKNKTMNYVINKTNPPNLHQPARIGLHLKNNSWFANFNSKRGNNSFLSVTSNVTPGGRKMKPITIGLEHALRTNFTSKKANKKLTAYFNGQDNKIGSGEVTRHESETMDAGDLAPLI